MRPRGRRTRVRFTPQATETCLIADCNAISASAPPSRQRSHVARCEFVRLVNIAQTSAGKRSKLSAMLSEGTGNMGKKSKIAKKMKKLNKKMMRLQMKTAKLQKTMKNAGEKGTKVDRSDASII
jgi:outer membrane murein-binding lipoprotein Lpp